MFPKITVLKEIVVLLFYGQSSITSTIFHLFAFSPVEIIIHLFYKAPFKALKVAVEHIKNSSIDGHS